MLVFLRISFVFFLRYMQWNNGKSDIRNISNLSLQIDISLMLNRKRKKIMGWWQMIEKYKKFKVLKNQEIKYCYFYKLSCW